MQDSSIWYNTVRNFSRNPSYFIGLNDNSKLLIPISTIERISRNKIEGILAIEKENSVTMYFDTLSTVVDNKNINFLEGTQGAHIVARLAHVSNGVNIICFSAVIMVWYNVIQYTIEYRTIHHSPVQSACLVCSFA